MPSSGLPIGFSWGSLAAQRWANARLDPLSGFNFVLEIEGLLVGGFSELSGLESSIEVETYREGGLNDFVHQLPGQTSHANLTLTHGLTEISTLWNWYYNVTQGIIDRKNGTIMLLDRQQVPVMYWNFRNAFPVKWSGPQFNAESNAVAFESLELAHEGLSKPVLGQVAALTRGGAQLAGWAGF